MLTKPVLYHCPQSRSETAFWMNEELGSICDIRLVNIREGDQKQHDFLAVNPLGKIPALKVNDVVITEAAAICAYLADAYPEKNLAPEFNDPVRGAYFRWLFYGSACVEPAMLDKFSGTVRENPASVGHGNFSQVTEVIARALEDGPWLLGDTFSTADIVLGSTLNFAAMFGALERKPPFADYLERLAARPAFKSAQAKNSEFSKKLGLS